MLDHDSVLEAVSAETAIERVREGLLSFQAGDWVMPAKVYLESPPFGDFRAMPARGGGFALLKWVTSFPGQPRAGAADGDRRDLPLERRRTANPLMLMDARSVTALRTGAVAAVAAIALARQRRADRRDHRMRAARRVVGAMPGGRRLRPRRLPRPAGRGRRRARAGARLDRRFAGRRRSDATWSAASPRAPRSWSTRAASTPDFTSTCSAPTARARPRRASAPVASCALFCDEWEQASHGGELTGAVTAGLVTRDRVSELGAVLAGDAPGRPGPDAVTLFDSTGLAVQDLAVAVAAFEAWEDNRVEAQTVVL